MATMRIVEYERMAVDAAGNLLPIAQEPAVAVQSVSFTTSTQSAAFNARTKYVRLESTVDAYVLFGSNPTATATTAGRIPASVVEYRGVSGGAATKLAVYDGSS